MKKQIKTIQSFQILKENPEHKILIESKHYYAKGLLEKEMEWDANGGEVSKKYFFYTKSGLLEREFIVDEERNEHDLSYSYKQEIMTTCEYLINDQPHLQIFYEHNTKGQLIKKWSCNAEEVKLAEFIYDPENRTSVEVEFDDTGAIALLTHKTYNEFGKVVREMETGSDDLNAEDYVSNYEYDDQQNLIKTLITESGEVTLEEDYFFDANGNETGSLGNDFSDQSETKIVREFSSDHLLMNEIQYANGVADFKKEIEYNSNRQISKEKSWQDDGEGGLEIEEVYTYFD